ncbi:hypothetical protein FBU30_001306 [Linnemannia zychae]|nr:hypothetical protein FBU30_001306 [Linnemannia zychae]
MSSVAPITSESTAATCPPEPSATADFPKLSNQSSQGNTNSDTNEGARDSSQTFISISESDSNSSRVSEELHQSMNGNRDDPEESQFFRQQSKERAIERVLQHGKILKISRRLRTRLEYAILKIRRGWSKYTLQEVESLIQPVMSPRISSKRPLTISTSPRYSSRKRVRKEYPDYEQPSNSSTRQHKRKSTDEVVYTPDHQTSPTEGRRYRSRLSFSQFKDSELFLPAKSLMDIATSSPMHSPQLNVTGGFSIFPNQYGIQSPLGSPGTPLYQDSTQVSNWSSFSQPTSPIISSFATFKAITGVTSPILYDDDESKDNGSEAPSETQAAKTILLLASSPTRPPPRTLDQAYLNRQATTAPASIKSPTASPGLRPIESGSSLGSSSGLMSGTAAYSPMTSSPLVHFQTTAASTPSPDKSPTLADSNPFLTRRAESGIKSRSDSLLTSDLGKQGSNGPLSASTTKRGPTSPSPLSTSSLPILASSPSILQEPTVRAMTPPPIKDDSSSFSSASPPPSSSIPKSTIPPRTPSPRRRSQPDVILGVRTPPPSEGKEGMNPLNYKNIATGAAATKRAGNESSSSIAASIIARRRSSGLAGGSGLDMSDSPAASPNLAGASPRGAVKRRTTANKERAARAPGPSTAGMMRIYTDDSPGLNVDPVVVLVLSLAFIASVFALHIYGKLTKA